MRLTVSKFFWEASGDWIRYSMWCAKETGGVYHHSNVNDGEVHHLILPPNWIR